MKKNNFLTNSKKISRSSSAFNFFQNQKLSRCENENIRINNRKKYYDNSMSKTTELMNNKKNNISFKSFQLFNNNITNNRNNNTNNNTNISINSLNDFGNTNILIKNNNSLNAKTTKNKYKTLISLRPFSSSPKINIDKINFYKKSNVPSHLDVLNLILKNSPERIDMRLVAQKMNLLNKEIKQKSLNSTNKKFYDYNIIFGYKTNNIIKSYTPKLILKKPSKKQGVTKNGQEIHQVFDEEEISSLFYQKCIDLNIPLKEELLNRFTDFIKLKCINRIIDLTDCKLGLNSMIVLREIIINKNSEFSRLILAKNNFGDKGIELLLESIKDNSSLVELNLSSNGITAKGGKLIFGYLLNQQSIISLDLSSHEGINRNRICADGVRLIEDVLQTNYFIENLDLSSNSIKTEGFKYLVNGLQDNIVLKYLNISNNEIDEIGMYYLKDNINDCKIEILDISSNPIGNEGCIALGKCLGNEKLNEITNINLSDCSIRFNGVREFFKNLRANKKISTLILNKNNLFSKKWVYLEDYFLNLNLKHLGLSSCSLNNSVVDISKILQHHPTLKILDLSHNQINDASFIYFKSYPKENLSLVELDFSRNYISDKSGKYFFENLINNRCMQKLNFFDNQLQNESANAIIESLRINHFLTYVNFKSNRVPIRIMKEINMRIQNNKLIEKEKFLPQLKREIKDLSFDPEEINNLKGRIILQNQEKELSIQKLKEDNKIIKIKKLENEKELNKIESESNVILSKIDNINKEIKKMNEMKEIEINLYNEESEKIEEGMTDLSNDIETIKIENDRYQDKYNDIYKRLKRAYDNTYKKYDDQRKFLMIEIDQLKSKQKKFASKIRILEKLKNLEKEDNNNEEFNKSKGNDDNTKEKKEGKNNSNSNTILKGRGKIRRNSTAISKKIEKQENKLKLREIKNK